MTKRLLNTLLLILALTSQLLASGDAPQTDFQPTMQLFETYVSPSLFDEFNAGETTTADPIYIHLKYPGVPRQDQLDVEAGDFEVTNGSITSISYFGIDFGFRVEVTPAADGVVTVKLLAGTTSRPNGDTNLEVSTSFVFSDLPKVTLSADTDPAVEGSTVYGTFTTRFLWDDDLTDFAIDDINFTNATAGTLTVVSPSEYTLELTPVAAGDITVTIPANAVTNTAGNNNNGSASITFTYDDATVPTVSSSLSSPTNASLIDFQINFNQSVSDFLSSDVQVDNGTISNFSGSGTTWDIEVTPIADGDVTLTMLAGRATASDGSRNIEAASTIAVDRTGPILTMSSTSGDPFYQNPATINFDFSEEPVGFELTDFIVTNGTLDNLSGSGTSYTAELTADNEGLVTITLPADVLTDQLGNGNPVSSFSITRGGQLPPVFTSSPVTSVENTSSNTYTYALSASDPNGDALSFSALTLPSWLSLMEETQVITFAELPQPEGIAVDSKGNVYVSSELHEVIYKYDTDGNRTIFAGQQGSSGFQDGTGTDARLYDPGSLIFDNDDNLYVADQLQRAIRKITPSGEVSTLAGSGSFRYKDGTGTAAGFTSIRGFAIDKRTGDLYATESLNGRIRKITASGVVTTFARDFDKPRGIAVDSQGNVFVTNSLEIIKINSDGTQSVFAGNTSSDDLIDGTGTSASFQGLEGMHIDADDNLYVADMTAIRKVNPEGVVTTVAGSDVSGHVDGPGDEARFYSGNQLAVGPDGVIHVVTTTNIWDVNENPIRKVVPGPSIMGEPAGLVGDFDVVIAATDGLSTPAQQAFTIAVTDVLPELTDFDFFVCEDCYELIASTGEVVQSTVTFNKPVYVTGQPYIEMDFNDEKLVYASGSGTNVLTFEWTAGTDMNNYEEITYTGTDALKLNGGTIKDATGNDAPLTLIDNAESFYLSTFDYALKSLTFNVPDGIYGIGEEIDIIVELEQAPGGVDYLEADLNSGGYVYDYDFDASSGTTYTLTYIVEEGDFAEDLDFEDPDETIYLEAWWEPPTGAYYWEYYDYLPADPAITSIAALRDIKIDGIRPEVTITTGKATAAVFVATLTFSEEVTGLELSDLVVGNGVASALSGSGSVYTVGIIPDAAGTVTIDLAADAVNDLAGNGNEEADQVSVTALDAVGVVVQASYASGTEGLIGSSSGGSATIIFSTGVTGFDQSDIVVDNLNITGFTANSASEYEITFESVAEGAATINVPEGVATDGNGRTNVAADEVSMMADLTPPTVSMSTLVSGPTNISDFEVNIEFNETITGLALSDFTVVNGTASNLLGSGSSYTVEITPVNGQVTIDLPASVVSDLAGNDNIAANQLSLMVDQTIPSIAITTAGDAVNAPFTATFTFSEEVYDFELTDIAVVNGTASDLSGTGAVYTATITPSGAGALTIDVAPGVAEDAAGNGNTEAVQKVITIDMTAPGVTISMSASSPVTGMFEAIFTFDESVTGFELSDIVVTNATVGNFTGSGATYTADITPAADGDVTINVAASVVQDAAGNDNTAAIEFSVAADITIPTVTLSTTESDPSNADVFTVDISFSEAISDLELSDLVIVNGTVSNLTGSDDAYTVEVTPLADGQVTVTLAASTVRDEAGNANTVSNQISLTSDRTQPGLTITTATNAVNGEFEATFNFDEPVTGFELSDIVVTNGTVSNFSGSGDSYTVDITPGLLNDVTINVAASVARDAAGNDNIVASQKTVATDLIAPGASIAADALVNGTFTATITFDEDVTGFELTDITVDNGTAANLSGSGSVYTVDITPTSEGHVTIDIAAGIAQDEAGNDNTAATPLSVTADLTSPAVTLSSTANDIVYTSSFSVTISFSEAVTGFTMDDLTLSNATVSNFAGSGSSYTVDIAPVVDGQVSISIAAGVAADAAGNTSTASNTITKTVEATNEAPTAVLLSAATVTENTASGFQVGTLTATDADLNDTHTFALVNGDGDSGNSSFDIVDNTLVTTATFDYETQSSYSIRIRATDSGGLIFDKVFSISITDEAEVILRVEGTLNFEPTGLGDQSALTYTIYNDGDAVMEVTSITYPTGFAGDWDSGQIAVGESREVTVTFSPDAVQTYSGTISIVTNAGTGTLNITGDGAIITSIEPVRPPLTVNVFPNPAKDYLFIDLSGVQQKAEVTISDLNGKSVFRTTSEGENELRVDVISYKQGVYLLRVESEGRLTTKKVMIRK